MRASQPSPSISEDAGEELATISFRSAGWAPTIGPHREYGESPRGSGANR